MTKKELLSIKKTTKIMDMIICFRGNWNLTNISLHNIKKVVKNNSLIELIKRYKISIHFFVINILLFLTKKLIAIYKQNANQHKRLNNIKEFLHRKVTRLDHWHSSKITRRTLLHLYIQLLFNQLAWTNYHGLLQRWNHRLYYRQLWH